MVKTRGSTSGTSKKGKTDRDTYQPELFGINERGEPILLQSILPQETEPEETPAKKSPILLLPWKHDVAIDEPNPGLGDQIQPEHSSMSGWERTHVPPIVDDTGKSQNPSYDSLEKVGSTHTSLKSAEGGDNDDIPISKVDVDVSRRDTDKSCGEEVDVPEKVSGDDKGVNPSVKETSDETIYKSAKTHSSVDPTVAEILVGMKWVKSSAVRGGRIKRRLRKQGVVVRHERKNVTPSVEEVAEDSPVEKDDDDILVISSTTGKSMRRTQASIAAFDKKRAALEKKKAAKKGKAKAKRPSTDQTGGSVPKKRNGVVISEPKSLARGNKFVVDEEGAAKVLREKSKGKLKVTDNRNTINNRRITKDVDDVPIDGVDFCSEEHEARTAGIMSNIGPHWPQLVTEFICNLSEEIVDPASSMFHKVKLRGHLGDIISELTGKAITTWPTKGQLQASNLSLKYVVLHKIAITNLMPTSKNTNVSEALDGLGEDAKPLTISDRLKKGKHVIDVEFNAADQNEAVPDGKTVDMLIKAYEEEQQRLEAEIQAKKFRVSELQAKIQALKATILPTVNDLIATSTVVPDEPTTADAAKRLSLRCNFLFFGHVFRTNRGSSWFLVFLYG
ncbi:hypothetical protein LIER_19803 [Lithospermum erythrorhizon]|uniref:Uncharacterized protein n=1 Tax=Lithospermum erythrorhizon TaxID=34254 RepID=A0AAV3QJ69_LITER